MSYNPRDLNISLRAIAKPQHVLNGGPKGATFPGWFLQVQENEGYDVIAGPIQLSIGQVKTITSVIDEVTGSDREHGYGRVTNAAERCDKAMRDELQRQLEVAEKAAERVPELRRRLGLDG